MLWNAGQKRLTREAHDHLAESFMAFRDAGLDVMVNTGQAKSKGKWRLPSYIQSSPLPVRHSTSERDAMLIELGAMFPGSVRRSDS